MASNVDTSGYQSDRYFARSWALLTNEKGWWKPVLICAAACLVPVVGPLAVIGYALEWARRIAWGSSEGPARHVKIGDLIRSGWRGAVVLFGWGIAYAIVGQVLANVPYLGDLLDLAWTIFSILLSMAFLAAAVRATIYQDFKAGYRVQTLYQMVCEDPAGLLRVWLTKLVAYVAEGVAAMIIIIPTVISSLSWIVRLIEWITDYSSYYGYSAYSGYSSYGEEYLLQIVSALLGKFGPALILLVAVALVIGVWGLLMRCAGMGLWMRRFDVPAWGRDEDPLPARAIAEKSEEKKASAAPVAPEEPVAAAEPVAPAEPVEPVAAAEPVSPVAPEASVEPAADDEPPVPGTIAEAVPADDAPEAAVAVEPVAVVPAEPPAPVEVPATDAEPEPAADAADSADSDAPTA